MAYCCKPTAKPGLSVYKGLVQVIMDYSKYIIDGYVITSRLSTSTTKITSFTYYSLCLEISVLYFHSSPNELLNVRHTVLKA